MEDLPLPSVIYSEMDSSLDPILPQMIALLPRLQRFALALTGGAVEADDLVQDTVERALKNLDQFELGTRMDSWMFRIAQNLWIDCLRAGKIRDARAASIEEAELVSVDGERAALSRMMLADTCRALRDLPEEQRAVIGLVLIDGLSYRDAASILQIPIGTLTSRLARAREALANHVLGDCDLRTGSLL
jgi:RNA polymerase sigma-70 factor (ECF subfamily)